MFEKIALVGIGLIGSSLARVIRREGLARHVAIATRSPERSGEARAGGPCGIGARASVDATGTVGQRDIVGAPAAASAAAARTWVRVGPAPRRTRRWCAAIRIVANTITIAITAISVTTRTRSRPTPAAPANLADSAAQG